MRFTTKMLIAAAMAANLNAFDMIDYYNTAILAAIHAHAQPRPIYNYNFDGSAVEVLNPETVNSYVEVENTLASLRTDRTRYLAYLHFFETALHQDESDTALKTSRSGGTLVPSYAPVGENQKLIVTVINHTIDYSAYTLTGDLNGDNLTDLRDMEMLNDALYNLSTDPMYDLNRDGSVDLKDAIYLSARLLTEISYFDFYTTSGEKLPIATRSVDDPKQVAYNGTASQVMVVAKDGNMASSFESGLSDLDTVWYNKTALTDTHQLTLEYEYATDSNGSQTRAAAVQSRADTVFVQGDVIQRALAYVSQFRPSPYLCGWNLSVDYSYRKSYIHPTEPTLLEGDEGIEGFDGYFNDALSYITPHFRDADMGNSGEVILHNKLHYIYTIGAKVGVTNEVSAIGISYKDMTQAEDGSKITRRYFVRAASVLYLSEADQTLTGKVAEAFKGTITLHRRGPTPQTEDFDVTVKGDNSFLIDTLPFGEYDTVATTECGCRKPLPDTFTFKQSYSFIDISDPNAVFENQPTYLNLTVLDKDNEKVKNKTVTLTASECAAEPYSESLVTDDNGNVQFDDLMPGRYNVIIDGKTVDEIDVCQNTVDAVTLPDNLWRLHITYVLPGIGSGTVTYKNFTLDCNDPLTGDRQSPDALVANSSGFREVPTCAYVNDDHLDMRTDEFADVAYSGGLAEDPDLGSDMTIATEGVVFEGYFTAGPMEEQVGSILWEGYYAHGPYDSCFGNFAANTLADINAGRKTEWSSMSKGDGWTYCDFVLEPCQDENCDAY